MARYGSTTTPLAANDTATLNFFASREDNIVGAVFADQPGDIYIEQSFDGINWDISTTYAVTANDGKGFSEAIFWPYVRIRYVNGGTDQTTFRLAARFSSAGYRG